MFQPLHIFRAGTYTALSGQPVTITPDDLAACAAAYDAARHEAPIVVGHPQTNGPAFGWIASLAAREGDLVAEPRDVAPEFAEAVRARRFAKISASFWPPSHPENPAAGVWSLRHVGFLGAAVPAVLGLRPAELAGDADDCITLEFAAGEAAPSTETPMADPTPADQTADFAAREAALNARETALQAEAEALAARAQALKSAEEATRRAELASFVSGLVDEGRVLPADQVALVTLLATAPPDVHADFAAPAESGDPQPRPSAVWLREWLRRLPKQIDFGEFASAAGGLPDREQIAEAEIDAAARRMAGLPPQTTS